MPNWTEAEAAGLKRVNAVIPAPVKAKGRIREPKGMNKTERQYAAHLELEKRIGEVLWYRYEGVTLRLGEDCRLTCDFAVLMKDGSLELHDCKVIHRGKSRPHIEDDALAKLRTAAEMYPVTIRTVWPTPTGEWDSRTY